MARKNRSALLGPTGAHWDPPEFPGAPTAAPPPSNHPRICPCSPARRRLPAPAINGPAPGPAPPLPHLPSGPASLPAPPPRRPRPGRAVCGGGWRRAGSGAAPYTGLGSPGSEPGAGAGRDKVRLVAPSSRCQDRLLLVTCAWRAVCAVCFSPCRFWEGRKVCAPSGAWPGGGPGARPVRRLWLEPAGRSASLSLRLFNSGAPFTIFWTEVV